MNCVSPGFVVTPLNSVIADDPTMRSEVEAGTPLARLGDADEVASAIEFLLGPESSYLTGQNLIIDGGSMLMRSPQARFLVQSETRCASFTPTICGCTASAATVCGCRSTPVREGTSGPSRSTICWRGFSDPAGRSFDSLAGPDLGAYRRISWHPDTQLSR